MILWRLNPKLFSLFFLVDTTLSLTFKTQKVKKKSSYLKENKPVRDVKNTMHRWNAWRSSAHDATVNTPGAFKNSLFRSTERCWCPIRSIGRGHNISTSRRLITPDFETRVRTQTLIPLSLSRVLRDRPHRRQLFGSCQLLPTQLPRLCSIPIPTTRGPEPSSWKKNLRAVTGKQLHRRHLPTAYSD